MNILSSFVRRSILKGAAGAVTALLLTQGGLVHAQVIPKKIAVYTDSIGDGGNVGGNPTTAAGYPRSVVSQYTSYPAYGASPNLYDLAWRIAGASGASSYEPQQYGGSTITGMVNGYKPDFATGGQQPAFGGLTLVQHAAAVQADTVIIHLGGNDRAAEGVNSPADRTAVVAYLIGMIGKQLAAEGRHLVVVEQPYIVPEDAWASFPYALKPNENEYYTPADITGLVSWYQNHMAALGAGINAGVAEVNAHYPGYAIRSNYWSDGTVAMNPGTTHEGLHPTLATHSAIAAAIAADVKAFRGW